MHSANGSSLPNGVLTRFACAAPPGLPAAPSPEKVSGDEKPCILIVDNNTLSLRYVCKAVQGNGMTALTARDGPAALALLQSVVPDLIIMDTLLPKLDGFETTRQIRRDPALNHVPVIFMTGPTETQQVVTGLAVGGVDCVHKPIVIDELLARVKVHLRNARTSYAISRSLDLGGRPTIGVSASGELLWHTHEAANVLKIGFPAWKIDQPLPEQIRYVVSKFGDRQTNIMRRTIDVADGKLDCVANGILNDGSISVTLLLKRPGEIRRLLKARLGITAREADVLLWISRGKSNRDVGDLLDIAPRTVNKHLEQIFIKLGVENRSSAAAVVIELLSG